MVIIWLVYADNVENVTTYEKTNNLKEQLITPNTYGRVLDIGAGKIFSLQI